ncbi:hypothetical protein GIB67_023882 [Kingdonia uniflora]|uniref:FAD-binding PCMH-type domain-containing protein n=1 Tax=Kingdonia uniflora TaxID=39325 RepID=A0A7J7NGR5_9MAGN|nr:hypothetical protein GIB67_023882 [Kingdonia uniflora]
MRSVSVDLGSETAWVQAGATLGELYYGIAEKSGIHGFPAGTCPGVGVGGHFSGGGLGTLLRKHGLGCDNIVDAKLVDVNGRILERATMGDDLFWAIRGGGASFGVILSWKIKLVVVPPQVTVFAITKTLGEGALKLAYKWQHIVDKLHEDLFIRLFIQVASGSQTQGKKTIQVLFSSMFLGGVEILLPLMTQSFPELGLLQKDRTQMSWIESILYFAGHQYGESLETLLDRNHAVNQFFKGKSDFVKEPISEFGLQGIFQILLEEEKGYMILDPLGGKMNKISESETPFPHRLGNLYNIQYTVKWKEQENEVSMKHMQWIRKLYGYRTPYVSNSPRTAYINYIDLDLGRNKLDGNKSDYYTSAQMWGRMYFKANFDRSARVKSKVDPDNFFRNEQSIPPLPYQPAPVSRKLV